ncbi:MAG: aldehyde dehydrogenase family protein [Deltaproteobacteria bacterium]|jgi:acyl-CoA reductase-like NAD-dependent aldehyde dehydrogenase|nr:aldehyde dehydrogenase family protein [Deltaproteobacteria bacterium]
MKKELWINGEWVTTEAYQWLHNPYSGEQIAEIAIASSLDVDKAIQSAEDTNSIMKNMPAFQRSQILEKVSNLLADKKQEAASILVQEASKPVSAALLEIERTIQTYRFAADEAKQLKGEVVPMDAAAGGVGRIGFTRREPLGVIGAISPFNFPFNLVAHKIGPAFAAGNTVVLKPASQTPLSAFFIAELFHEAGLPPGALNVIAGNGSVIGDILVTDERVKMITFTGSPDVGKHIRARAGLKRVTLELGSNSALIVDRGVDIDKIIPRCITGAFAFQGQVCISLQRAYVHQELLDSFVSQLVSAANNLKGGDPADPETDYSALINSNEAQRVCNWIKDAESAGATVQIGGERTGNIVTPTVLTNAPGGLKISCQEVFGPVVVVYPFSKLDNALQQVNNSVYGLQAGIYTPFLDHALEAAEKLEVGGVMINDIPTFRVDQMPYGGVKESGVGREGLKYAIEEMTEMKLIVIQKS